MSPVERKLVTIIAESALEKMLVKDLKSLGITGYTVWDVRGEGTRGKRKGGFDQSSSICLTSICNSTLAQSILEHLSYTYFEDYAIVAYISDVQIHRCNRF